MSVPWGFLFVFQGNGLVQVVVALLSREFPWGVGVRILYSLWTLLFSHSVEWENVGWKSCSVPRAEVSGTLSRAGVAGMAPGLESSREVAAHLFPPLPQQSSECFSLVYQMSPSLVGLLIPLLYISFLSFLHCMKFQITDLFRAGNKLFCFMRMNFRCGHLYITFFNCSLKRNKLLVIGINLFPLAGSSGVPRSVKLQKHLSNTRSAGIALLQTNVRCEPGCYIFTSAVLQEQRGSVNRKSWKIGFFVWKSLPFMWVFKIKKGSRPLLVALGVFFLAWSSCTTHAWVQGIR